MPRKGLVRILEYFGETRMIVGIGFLSFVYFIIHLLPETRVIAKILPLWPIGCYAAASVLVLGYQIFTWKKFKLFQNDWYKAAKAWVLFFSEFWVLLFSIGFISWPLYYLTTFIKL